MLHHHGREKQLTEAEREKLVSEGAAIQGMVVHSEPSATDRRMSQVRVSVRFKDDQPVEFSEELANLYQPAPDSPEARRLAEVRGAGQLRHPDRIPKIQLPLSVGARVPVRYDAGDRRKIVIDIPELQKRALHDYIQREQQQKDQSATRPGARNRPALDGAVALPELRRSSRPGEGVPGSRPVVPVLPPADTSDAAALRDGCGAASCVHEAPPGAGASSLAD